jgi:TRAP-type C4-dicarboxylate transport system substrate-binding protein
MNKKKFDGMPKEDQELFSRTALEAAKFQRKVNRDAEEESLKDMAAKGVTVIRDVDRASFKKAMMPAYDAFSSEVSKAEIEKIMNAK